MTNIDYSKYEGQKIIFEMSDYTHVVGVVAGLDPDIGVSIKAEGSDEYLFCYHGPSSPRTKRLRAKGQAIYPDESEKALFAYMFDCIKKGRINMEAFDLIHHNLTSLTAVPRIHITSDMCAFNE